MTDAKARVAVANVNHPGKLRLVDARSYAAMRRAMLKALPSAAPGLTLAELRTRLFPMLPETVFPGGAKAGWWLKTVQLDLEEKGAVVRTRSTPLRLYRRRGRPQPNVSSRRAAANIQRRMKSATATPTSPSRVSPA